MQAFLHFGTGNEPRQTVSVPVRNSDAPRSGQTVTGYGSKIPAPYLVQWEGRWRRVYVAQYGNAGSAYIGKPGAWLATVDIDHAEPEAAPAMAWAAGWNLPGFMPDSAPEHFETAQEARDYIAAEMRRYADDDTAAEYADSETEGERVANMLRTAADECDALEGDSEFGRTVGGYHYWATRL